MKPGREHPVDVVPKLCCSWATGFSQPFSHHLHPGTHPGLAGGEGEEMGTCNATVLTLHKVTHFYTAKLLPGKTCCSLRSPFWKRSERVPRVGAERGLLALQGLHLQGWFCLPGFTKHMQNKHTAVQS